MKRGLLFFLGIIICSSIHAVELNPPTSYAKVKAKSGDAVFKLLRKYHLMEASCNIDAFYSLNNMSKSDPLLANKTYQLPIAIYQYNGTSIRSTIGNNDWDLAVSIQTYNEKLRDAKVKPTIYREDKILYVPHHLVNCEGSVPVTASAPTKEYVKTDIFFGTGEKIEKKSNVLQGKVYYIISGHGGPDPGAMKKKGNHQLCEDEYAYDVSLRLAKNLLEEGATVHMIIQDKNDGIREEQLLKMDRDEICKDKGAIPLNQKKRLQQRVSSVNGLYKKEKSNGKTQHTVIAIHVDSRSVGQKQDVFFYYSPGSRTGKKIANNIQNTFRKKYQVHRKNRNYTGTVTSRGLYVLRKTNPPAVYVELANIQNTSDQKRILPASNRQALANWLYEGLTGQTIK
ncbi:MAG: N-acetylmuramoyl-L-alanine amidase [Saprospiraceae bacterium]|nr:N-acetylmuramoyl-L-alanine amidase [Saprospiraceae bacterium]